MIDDYIDLNYWKYLGATAEYRRKAHENCFAMYVTLFEEWIEMGGEVQLPPQVPLVIGILIKSDERV